MESQVNVAKPPGLEYLPFQKAGIACAASRTGTLLADEMGLGKTVQAIGTISEINERAGRLLVRTVLIICPSSLKINWRRELEKWLTRPYHVSIGEGAPPKTLAEVMRMPDEDHGSILILNYDLAARWRELLFAQTWDLLIADEAHALKNPKAKRTQAILGSGRGKHASDFLAPLKSTRKIFISGTPILNKPVEIWPLLQALAPDTWKDFFPFALRYCNAHKVSAGRKQVWDFSGSSNVEELQKRLRETVMIRRLKTDVLRDLPPKRRQIIELPADKLADAVVSAETKAWNAAIGRSASLRAAVAAAETSEDPAVYNKAAAEIRSISAGFTELARLRHKTAIRKLPYVIEHLQDSIEEGKVICFAHHRDVIETICRAFPGIVVRITGDSSATDRDAAVQRFQQDPKCLLFVGNLAAAGVGLTLTASAHVVFAELDWVPAIVNQAEDRAHRIGQTNSVLVQHLVLSGSIDAKIAKTLVEKQSIINRALDAPIEEVTSDRKPPSRTTGGAPERTPPIPDAVARNFTEGAISVIHKTLRFLAGLMSAAETPKGRGLEPKDANLGLALAHAPKLDPRKAAVAAGLIQRHPTQIPGDLASAPDPRTPSTAREIREEPRPPATARWQAQLDL